MVGINRVVSTYNVAIPREDDTTAELVHYVGLSRKLTCYKWRSSTDYRKKRRKNWIKFFNHYTSFCETYQFSLFERLKMIRLSLFSIFFLFSFLSRTESRGVLSRRQRGGASSTFEINSRQALQQARLAQTRGVVGVARDGTLKVIPMTAEIEGFAVQFKVAGTDIDFEQAAQPGATIRAEKPATSVIAGEKGINLVLHGDGGQSFFDFPNRREQKGLLGVVALAPNDKMFWGGGGGNRRADGVLHSKLIDELITKILPQVVIMDPAKVFFMGISGGSFLLAGFFLPTFAEKYNSGAILGCGALPPQVRPSEKFGKALGTMRVHFQTSTQEQEGIQLTIPQAITSYIAAAKKAGVDNETLGKKLTADTTPKGQHCAFDGKGFVSGIQLLADNYDKIIFGDGDAKGIGKVSTSVLENNQRFASGVQLTQARERGTA
ncbi:hypothetical protein PCASD_22991 [Puccinia coronata f. sp. avenae]|uniref:Uncharacterized protein n=1 Tax=Puccinia coronata f. sp. avenae TaxID=200324 RepID=A0A2N5SHP2_9BASI|nr:hypothetical protein PCASD_22991 [Puccinia coronata f. sp. avenae]